MMTKLITTRDASPYLTQLNPVLASHQSAIRAEGVGDLVIPPLERVPIT
jgi:hypothetical protein